MKYYKNLIKRKEFGVIIISLIFFLLGSICFYFNFLDFIIKNIDWSNLSYYMIFNSGIVGIIGASNIGMTIIGLFIMYIGLIFIPFNSPYSQDDSDYKITIKDEYIHIFYKKNEFLVKKETFAPTDLFFKDKNKHFVSITRGYQIYNYIMYKYKNLTEKEINNSKIILKSEIINKFNNVRTTKVEEKNDLILKLNLNYKNKISFLIISIILWIAFTFFSLGIILSIIELDFTTSITSTILSLILFILAKKSTITITKDKKTIEKIMYNDLYLIECKIFDKKHLKTSDTDGLTNDHYYIKLTDDNYIIDEWFEVDKNIYYQKDNPIIKVYTLKKDDSIFYIFK